jgi:glycosyltransferase involved in cell wall biosynthesis
MHSIILTIHNKEWLIEQVLDGIMRNTKGDYEIIVVLDGCTDKSSDIVNDFLSTTNITHTIITTPDVFETRANNSGLKNAKGDYVIIVQDDMIIKESGWNLRMQKPFDAFDDVFAVTSRTAHNWKLNPNTIHLGMIENLDNCWCDICIHTEHADRSNIPRDIFAVRASVNRGPLMIDHSDLKKLNYFDEKFSPQDMDDHDLIYRMHKELGKVCGCYWIDFESKDEWGGTRVSGLPASWLLKANHKNMKLFYSRHKDFIELKYQNENRRLVDG